MGLYIALETESGEELEKINDSKNILYRLLSKGKNKEYELLNFIDFYGDSVFNRVQMNTLMKDFLILRSNCKIDEEKELLNKILTLCDRCLNGAHLYVKFYGD